MILNNTAITIFHVVGSNIKFGIIDFSLLLFFVEDITEFLNKIST